MELSVLLKPIPRELESGYLIHILSVYALLVALCLFRYTQTRYPTRTVSISTLLAMVKATNKPLLVFPPLLRDPQIFGIHFPVFFIPPNWRE